ncbi:hypothetical protein COCNU_15G005400 [Cocos nucifera]|uniref:K-box domain-containing protein n=1 Tax=Cocos nucifera TaxID=13894 RepID=A0A8K0IXI0_COCNU|nr:hypothetical protein COCNU_15G005400 [Cocos nucifera]
MGSSRRPTSSPCSATPRSLSSSSPTAGSFTSSAAAPDLEGGSVPVAVLVLGFRFGETMERRASDLWKDGVLVLSALALRVRSSQQEYLKLKARVEALQRSQRNLLGEDLGPLSSKELEQLERQLDASLKQIRSTRTQYMLDQLADLQRREQMLCEANKSLRRRLEESNQAGQQQVWDPTAHAVGYGRQPPQPQSDGFYQQIDSEPTLQIGYLFQCQFFNYMIERLYSL